MSHADGGLQQHRRCSQKTKTKTISNAARYLSSNAARYLSTAEGIFSAAVPGKSTSIELEPEPEPELVDESVEIDTEPEPEPLGELSSLTDSHDFSELFDDIKVTVNVKDDVLPDPSEKNGKRKFIVQSIGILIKCGFLNEVFQVLEMSDKVNTESTSITLPTSSGIVSGLVSASGTMGNIVIKKTEEAVHSVTGHTGKVAIVICDRTQNIFDNIV